MPTIAQDHELDLGANRIAPGMQRHCALTRTLKPVDDMVRFVIGPGGHTVPDVKRKLPGRGIWVTGTRAAIEQAIKENVFTRAFKQNVRVSADLAATTEKMLTQSALDALAIASKAGQVVAGFAKVEGALGGDNVLALIHAAEAASDGRRKLDAAAQREMAEKSRQIALVELFTGEQLDLALNRPNVVHAALLAGPVSDTFLARAKRLERFRTGTLPELTSAQAPIEGA
jgi:predicted RNA-binding protein YlxR (DUF448 family)